MEPIYQVRKNTGSCKTCEKEFVSGQPYFSSIRQAEDSGELIREDYCTSCWEEVKRDELFSFWTSHYQNPEEKPKIKTDAVLDFFENLGDAISREKRNLRFVLALFLIRKKTFKFEGTKTTGDKDYLVVRKVNTEETIMVEDPHLTQGQVSQATSGIKELF